MGLVVGLVVITISKPNFNQECLDCEHKCKQYDFAQIVYCRRIKEESKKKKEDKKKQRKKKADKW